MVGNGKWHIYYPAGPSDAQDVNAFYLSGLLRRWDNQGPPDSLTVRKLRERSKEKWGKVILQWALIGPYTVLQRLHLGWEGQLCLLVDRRFTAPNGKERTTPLARARTRSWKWTDPVRATHKSQFCILLFILQVRHKTLPLGDPRLLLLLLSHFSRVRLCATP